MFENNINVERETMHHAIFFAAGYGKNQSHPASSNIVFCLTIRRINEGVTPYVRWVQMCRGQVLVNQRIGEKMDP